jgi:hypothetical protein
VCRFCWQMQSSWSTICDVLLYLLGLCAHGFYGFKLTDMRRRPAWPSQEAAAAHASHTATSGEYVVFAWSQEVWLPSFVCVTLFCF